MKAFALILALAAVMVFLGWRIAAPDRAAHDAGAQAAASRTPPPTSIFTDPTEVFQKAFWKRPNERDRILHAERREWADMTGLQRWQWFIKVDPSPELVQHLITDNAFSLAPRKEFRLPDATSPAWFPTTADKNTLLVSRSGSYILLWDKAANVICATDSGGGFRPGAPEKLKPEPESSVALGRLPNSPPPKPSQP